MNKLVSNYKVLFALRILKNILTTFLDSFLVLYFLQVSNNNILPIGIYKFVAIVTIYAVIFFNRNLCKTKHRITLLRIGIILNFIYFLSIIILKERIVDHIYLIGLLYGLEEGFYYSVYHVFETDGVDNKDRAKFTGIITAINSILYIILPTVFGGIIQEEGFINTLLIALGIILAQIVLSFMYEDTNIPKNSKADIKGFYKIVKEEPALKQTLKREFWVGLTYSEGAFASIITIYIIKVFSTSVSLGIFTSIFSLISAVIGVLFAKVLKPKHYTSTMFISTILTIIALFAMIYDCNMVTIILFNLFQNISYSIVALVNEKNIANLANINKVKNEYKVEYYLTQETGLVLGRILSNGLFIMMAFTNSNIILYIFVFFVWMYTLSSIKLQDIVEKRKNKI